MAEPLAAVCTNIYNVRHPVLPPQQIILSRQDHHQDQHHLQDSMLFVTNKLQLNQEISNVW